MPRSNRPPPKQGWNKEFANTTTQVPIWENTSRELADRLALIPRSLYNRVKDPDVDIPTLIEELRGYAETFHSWTDSLNRPSSDRRAPIISAFMPIYRRALATMVHFPEIVAQGSKSHIMKPPR